jgi:site-specific DNA-methyltransferase (adenine-specific)
MTLPSGLPALSGGDVDVLRNRFRALLTHERRPFCAQIKMSLVTDIVKFNAPQRGDALALLQSLPDCVAAAVVFDPQHRSVLDHLKLGNESARQIGRAALPVMSETYIDHCIWEAARILAPSGYVFLWADTYRVCEGAHLRVADAVKCVDLISWDSLRLGMGKRSRRRGDYVLVLQRPPIIAKDRSRHPEPLGGEG